MALDEPTIVARALKRVPQPVRSGSEVARGQPRSAFAAHANQDVGLLLPVDEAVIVLASILDQYFEQIGLGRFHRALLASADAQHPVAVRDSRPVDHRGSGV